MSTHSILKTKAGLASGPMARQDGSPMACGHPGNLTFKLTAAIDALQLLGGHDEAVRELALLRLQLVKRQHQVRQ